MSSPGEKDTSMSARETACANANTKKDGDKTPSTIAHETDCANVNTTEEGDSTPLIFASPGGHLEILKYFMEETEAQKQMRNGTFWHKL